MSSLKRELPRDVLLDPGAHVSDFIKCEKTYLPSGAILYRAGNARALETARVWGADPDPKELLACALRVAEMHLAQSEDLYNAIKANADQAISNAALSTIRKGQR